MILPHIFDIIKILYNYNQHTIRRCCCTKFVLKRYATNQAEFCSVLMAMKRLKKLRKEEFIANNGNTDWHKQLQRKVDYILVFAGNTKGRNDKENHDDNDESYLYLDNMAEERITQMWTKEGGSIGGNNLDPNDPVRSNPL